MVGIPGSSTRCLQCRQRKKKCGLEQPSCLRCVQSKLQCSGPGQKSVFVNRNGKNLHQKTDKAALNAAFRARYAPPTCTPTTFDVAEGPLKLSSSRALYDALVNEFTPRHMVGIFDGDRSPDPNPLHSDIATSTRTLTGLVSRTCNIVDIGVFTLLAKYYGTLVNDQGLVHLAGKSHTQVLGLLHQQLMNISTPVQSGRWFQGVFAVCLAMLHLEDIEERPSEHAQRIHVEGALALLGVLGPNVSKKIIDQKILCGFRSMAIFVFLKKRKGLFLTQKRWRDVFCWVGPEAQLEPLNNLAIQVPGLLEQTDLLVSQQRTVTKPSTGDLDSLLQNYLALTHEFDDCYREFIDARSDGAYWSVDEDSDEYAVHQFIFNRLCQPSFPKPTYKLRFRDGAAAGWLSRYWCCRLELLDGTAQVYKLMAATSCMEFEADASRYRERATRLKEETNQLARRTLEAVNYLHCCLEGVVTAHGPWDIVERYNERKKLET